MVAEVETILQEMTRRLAAEFAPCQIYSFGSHAWGKPNEDSDIDLFVIVPDSTESHMERGLRQSKASWFTVMSEFAKLTTSRN